MKKIKICYRLPGHAAFTTTAFESVAAFFEAVSGWPWVYKKLENRVVTKHDFVYLNVMEDMQCR